ncbi:CHAT domain-containing protein [Amycolatopsis magusensis]|uniref:CHAT domain-containing protein/tetratricopeptide (TPR) repeat protein n=1 Tax=Amycolatopsis magusensis TaxID=882444 RepID=A0ABS4PRN2_9PSEU|nr:CHAT domain-containing protein [Amycolatopsis magusensis]MBP2182084.1 CHAT domain-containing protein/tetratricopeptide (TPR) repeat protein [Amycolatopsis magusensis]
MPVIERRPTEVIRRAWELQRSGVDASCAQRQHEATRLLRRGIRLLDSIHPVPADHQDDWLRSRIRLLTTLAFSEAETVGLTNGLARLDDVLAVIERFDDPAVRAELIAPVNHNRGLLLMGGGRNEESIACFDAALGFREESLAVAPDPAPVVESLLNTLATRGLAYIRLGRVKRAREDLNRGIKLAEKYELRVSAAEVRRHLGTLELRVGNVPAALRCYEESERSYRALEVEVPPLLRHEQAQALLTAGLSDEAGRHLDEVLPQLRQEQGNTRELGQAELFRAEAALLSGDLDLARSLAESARQRMRKWGCQTCVANATIIGLRADTADALRTGEIPAALPARALRHARAMSVPRLAEQATVAKMLTVRLEIRRGNLRRASELLAEVPRPGQLTPTDHRMLRRLCRAELAVAHDDRGAALGEIRAGLAELDRVRDRMGGLELLSGTALHGRELGELAVRLVLGGEHPRRLFDWLERTRAQTYRYEPLAQADDPELAECLAEIRGLTQSIHQALHDGHPTAAARARRAELLREAHRMGWHAGQWGKARPVAKLDEVAARLKNRALVSFAASADELVAVVVLDGGARIVRLGSAKQASESARMLNVDLNAVAPDHTPQPLVEVIMTSARRQAERLDAQLVRPLLEVTGDRDLVIVPTGGLYAVPWGVLPSLHYRPTVVAPSATAWLSAELARNDRARKIVLVRGPGLPAARAEIDKLATHYRASKQLSGQGATATAVLPAVDGAKLAHIAAHGAHEPENALFSRLELADGAMFAHEMAGLRRPPRQVVLAACELALNRIRPGDEALGFASALLASGSQTVIAPLSKVGDQSSAAAMDDYHRALAGGASPAVALADAVAVDPMRRPFVCLGAG